MPGSLRKRGNSWELRVYAGTDPETGKQHWVSATVKGSDAPPSKSLQSSFRATPETSHRGHRRALWRATAQRRSGWPTAHGGTVHRIHVVLHRALEQALRWSGSGSIPQATPLPCRANQRRCAHRHRMRLSGCSVTSRRSISRSMPSCHSRYRRARDAARSPRCAWVRSISRTGRSDSSRRSSMQKVARCCARRRPDAPTGWTSTRTVLKY